MLVFELLCPTRIRFGAGTLSAVAELLGDARAGRWLVVSGQGAVARAGHLHRLLAALEGEITEFSGVPPNPHPAIFEAAVHCAREAGCDRVAAIGGGSVLDVAKAVAFLAPRTGALDEYLDGREPGPIPPLPCLAIPTTAGTGSEVTRWATIWDWSRGSKRSLDHEFLYPRWAVVDPELASTLPPDLTAISALDALSHACEACWSRHSQPYSRALAFQAIGLLRRALPTACEAPRADRCRLGLASLLAGLAFGQTRTALAHSISYGLTLRFRIPHGIAASVTLPSLLRFNRKASSGGVKVICGALGVRSHDAGWELTELIESAGVPVRLSAWGVAEADLGGLADAALANTRAGNNPRPVRRSDIVRILREAL